MVKINGEEVMDKFDIFQPRLGKIDEFGWWGLEGISADSGMQFTSTQFQRRMSNPQCSYDVSSSGASENK